MREPCGTVCDVCIARQRAGGDNAASVDVTAGVIVLLMAMSEAEYAVVAARADICSHADL